MAYCLQPLTLCVTVVVAITGTHAAQAEFVSSDSYSDFAHRVYHYISSHSGQEDNVLYSPLGVSLGLGLAWCGAAPGTRTKLQQLLGQQDMERGELQQIAALLGHHNRSAGVNLHMANAMVLEGSTNNGSNFANCSHSFHGNLLVKPQEEAEVVNGEVNDWMAEHTSDKIQHIVDKDDQSLGQFSLLSAAYFKGMWVQAFKSGDTEPRPFFITPNTTVDIDMMYFEGELGYANDRTLHSEIIKLPYSGGKSSLYIVLPHAIDGGLEKLEGMLASHIRDIFNSDLELTSIKLILPKLKVIQSLDMRALLVSMGMGELFEGESMDKPAPHSHLQEALHKSYIELDEEGVRAATQTDPQTSPEYKFVHADRPFMFFITDEVTQNPVFMGRLSKPFDFSKDRGDTDEEYYYYVDGSGDGDRDTDGATLHMYSYIAISSALSLYVLTMQSYTLWL